MGSKTLLSRMTLTSTTNSKRYCRRRRRLCRNEKCLQMCTNAHVTSCQVLTRICPIFFSTIKCTERGIPSSWILHKIVFRPSNVMAGLIHIHFDQSEGNRLTKFSRMPIGLNQFSSVSLLLPPNISLLAEFAIHARSVLSFAVVSFCCHAPSNGWDWRAKLLIGRHDLRQQQQHQR